MSAPSTRPINVREYEAIASQYLQKQVYDYYRSGANDEVTLGENVAAYNRLIMRPRCCVDVSNMDLSTTILGQRISSPIMIAPMAMQRMAHVDGEVATARAAATANTFMCLSSLSTTNLTDLREAVPELKGIFQLYVYKDRSVSLDLIRRAEAAGYKALCVTVDTPFIGFRESDVRNGFALPAHLTLANFTSSEDRRGKIGEKSNGSGLIAYSKSLFDRSITWKDIAWLIGQTKLPVILKGIMTEEDALMAVEVGAAGILVSNHGARQVDTCAATIEALPAIVAAVGDKLEVYVDGGIRRGVDVFKALALGARAVFVGRPFLWGLSHSGEAGVTDVHQILHAELENVMGLSGTPNLAAITRSFVTTREAMRPKL